jgi:hypothetical protein
MAREPLPEDVLIHVDDSRRDFLKRVVGGTAFAVPLMASFSMDGLAVDRAQAGPASVICGNMSLVSNMIDGDFTGGVLQFRARLATPAGRNVGTVRLELRDDCVGLAYTASLGQPLLLTQVTGTTWYPAFRLRTDDSLVTVGLVAGKGQIQVGSGHGLTAKAFQDLLLAMASGHALVEAVTAIGLVSGPVVLA